jgi:hypothetical protein
MTTSQTSTDFQDAGFGELDDLLAEALTEQRTAREAKEARERTKRGGQSSTEREADAERIRRWEAQHEWRAVANVAQFHRYSCQCGKHSTVFEQLMERQQHRHLRDSQRYQLTKTTKADLPNEVVIRKTSVPVCPSCALLAGWDLNKSTVWGF